MADLPVRIDPNGPMTSLVRIFIGRIREAWGSGGLGKTIKFLLKEAVFSKAFILSLLCGIGMGFILALGQSYAIGFYPAWKIYGRWWVVSPSFGPSLFILMILMALLVEYSERTRTTRFILGSFFSLAVGASLLVAAYKGTREENPLLSSQPASLEALSKSAREQSRVLGDLSESGQGLLSQLNSTEIELETAKKQLALTLGNFDAQRKAAGQVTEELGRIDARQKQIALQTGELERILEGQQPITRQDLQRTNMQGMIFGFIEGFFASILATMALRALRKRKSFSD